MKKWLLSFLLVLMTCFTVFGIVGCEDSNESTTPPPPATNDGGDEQTPALESFTGIAFDAKTVDYNGQEHTINVAGAPEFATVEYTNHGPFVNAGTYQIGVKITADNYNTYEKTVTLTINKINFTGIVFDDKTVDYDGEDYTINATGAPAFATVTYSNHGPFVNADTYEIGVSVSADNYNTYQDTATLTINKIDFTGITFTDKTEEYDGLAKEIVISGTLPSTADVVYTSDVSGVTNSATEIGVYNVTATITERNHNRLVLNAKLTIKATDEERFMAFSENGMLFFQNAMDDNELYVYDSANSALERVSGDIVLDLIPYGQDGVMYVSKTLFMSSIKTSSYDGTDTAGETILTESARYIQADGTVVYYVINGLTQNQSGIYKTDFTESEPVTTCLSVGKAKYLKLDGTKLYFADGNNGYKLSCINTTGTNQTRTLLVDEKINNLTVDSGALYYTVNNLLGNYIEKYTISTQSRRKLTIDAGESLTIVGDYLYYVNVDVFTTTVIGNGIYRVNTSPLVDYNLSGSPVIEAGDLGLCSLASDGECLYYYDVDGYKLMRYDINTELATNLLEDFEKPVDSTPISTGSKVVAYGGNIYYLDIWDGKALRCYNPTTGVNYRMTTEKAVDFAIINGVLYVNTVSNLVNNDTYYVDLKVGGTLEKLNAYSAYDFCSDGTYLYYVEENASGARTAVHKCNLDGTDDTIIYDKGVTNLRVVGNCLYFIDGSNIHSFDMTTSTDTTVKVDSREIHTDAFDTDGTYLYYRDMYGVLYANKRLARCRLDGTDDVKLVSEDTDPIHIVYQDGYVYYYTDTNAGYNGLYRVSASASANTTPTVILTAGTYYAKNFAIVDGTIYFVDYKSQIAGNAHLYQLTIGETEPELIR